jgi:hypothetical protein
MISSTLKAIQETKSKLAALEKKAAAEQKARIQNLHKEAGFATRQELIEALQALGGAAPKKVKARGRKAAKAVKPAKASKATKTPKAKKAVKKGAKKRAKRTIITAELRKGIIAALKAGGTGAAIASKFGVSVPTLHNIKKAAGLTKARKK